MDSETIRSLIREVLADEISALRGAEAPGASPRPRVREERVRLSSDADLRAFVLRILDLAKDGKARQEIESGRWRFLLDGAVPNGGVPNRGLPGGSAAGGGGPGPGAAPAVHSTAAPAAARREHRIDGGLVNERQIDKLPKGTTMLVVGKRASLTPLARDRARQKGILIERAQ
jgi:hypothetical protein